MGADMAFSSQLMDLDKETISLFSYSHSLTETPPRLLTRVEHLGHVDGNGIKRNCPSLAHLLFAGDLFIFAEATYSNLQRVFRTLHTYQEWAGQVINRTKPSILFNRNMPRQRRKEIC